MSPRADYRVRLQGRNFWLADGDVVARYAFDVAVFVCAGDPEEAAQQAMQALADDDDLRDAVRNTPDDPPLVFTLETVRLDPAVAPPPKRNALDLRPDDGTQPEPGLPEEPVHRKPDEPSRSQPSQPADGST